jgi:hypothetical protein
MRQTEHLASCGGHIHGAHRRDMVRVAGLIDALNADGDDVASPGPLCLALLGQEMASFTLMIKTGLCYIYYAGLGRSTWVHVRWLSVSISLWPRCSLVQRSPHPALCRLPDPVSLAGSKLPPELAKPAYGALT